MKDTWKLIAVAIIAGPPLMSFAIAILFLFFLVWSAPFILLYGAIFGVSS